MKLIIDCDTGTDDAQAIMLVLSQPSVEVIGITCVAGNTRVHQAAINTLRVLQICQRTNIPVFIGADSPLTATSDVIQCRYHGVDGLGDVYTTEVVDNSQLESEPAAVALVRLTKKHQGELTLLALGPLTNIALAIKLDPSFGKNLKNVVIMGGNMEATGTVNYFSGISGEFNFSTDPEAASIVLNQIGIEPDNLQLIPLETCMNSTISWEFCENTLMSGDSIKKTFHRDICRSTVARKRAAGYKYYVTCDPCAAAVAIDKQAVANSCQRHCDVELNGSFTRGQMVAEHRTHRLEDVPPNATVVTELNFEVVQMYMAHMLS